MLVRRVERLGHGRLRDEELALARHGELVRTLTRAAAQQVAALRIEVGVHATARQLLEDRRARQLHFDRQLLELIRLELILDAQLHRARAHRDAPEHGVVEALTPPTAGAVLEKSRANRRDHALGAQRSVGGDDALDRLGESRRRAGEHELQPRGAGERLVDDALEGDARVGRVRYGH
eukprot:1779665-Prymnesium_polylepis.3